MLTLAAAAALLLTGGCNCNERTLDEEPASEPDGRAACMILVGSKMLTTDGRVRVLRTAERKTPSVCLCLTDEEFETLARHDEMNDMALEVCEQAALDSDVALDYPLNNCAELHAEGEWLDAVYWAGPKGNFSTFVPRGFSCG